MGVKPFFDDLAIAVLSGAPIKPTAVKHDLSLHQLVGILNNFCRRSDPRAFRAIQRVDYVRDLPIATLRKHKDCFIHALPACEPLTESSSIWCLEGVLTKTLNGLCNSGIDTIDELLKTPREDLPNIPNLGQKGLRSLFAALASYGFIEPSAADVVHKPGIRRHGG